MANYEPPSENLPIFDVTTFRNDNPYSDIYLARKGLATSEATETSFSGLVSFNSLTSPPHCSAVAVNPNDLANKAYVDALAPQTSYIVFLNYSQTFTTSTPTIYKKLNPLTNNTPTTVPFHTVNTTPLLIAGFFNTKSDLKFANTIPAGLWNLVLYANCAAVNDQNHLGLNFVLIGVTSLGVETIIETSAYSPLINVLSPLIGTYSCVLTVTTAIDITAYDQIGIKVYALSNTSAARDGSIFFQYPSYYSALQTSFATTQAADITVTNNLWTGTNTFQNTTNLNTTIIQGTGSIQFPDLSIQTTAFKSLLTGIYTNSNITVDAQGAISAISTGVGGANAETIDLTLTASGTGYYIPYSTTTGLASTLRSGGLVYNRDTNTLAVNATNATNLIGGSAGLIPYQSGASTTAFIPAGTAGKVLQSNGTAIPTWTTDIGGNAGSSTTIALTAGDDSNGDWFIPYSKTTSATSNALYIDNTTTPLTYNANLGILSAKEYTIGGSGKVIGTNTSSIYQVTTQSVYVSWASGSQHRFYTYTAANGAVNPLNLTSLACNTTVPLNIVASAATATSSPSLSISNAASNQTVNITPFAPVGTSNPITTIDSSVISCGGGTSTRRMVLTTNSATAVGIRMSETALIIGAGGTVGPNPTHYIGFTDTTGINTNSTICPTQTGYTLPAGTDATSNIATAQWVQSAIPLATSASSNNLTGGVIGNVLYQASAGSTTRMTNGVAGTVLTSGGSGAVPTWSANLAGNAGSATLVNLTAATTGSGNYIPISTNGSGNSALLTNANLVYDHATNTITGNVTGSAGSAGTATNLTGGAIGNVLYQASAGSTTRMTNGAAGTVLTSGGSGAVPTWSANLAGNAGSATYTTNTTITNDLASATSHALTFVSNTTGNLPQKTRANVGTGEGLTYIPSTNALNVNIGGVGSVSTAKIELKDNLGNISDIDNTSGSLSINNRTASGLTYLFTANSAGTMDARVGVSELTTLIINKLSTPAGIIGTPYAITYTSDMIGYTIKKNGTIASLTITSGVISGLHASGTNGVALVAGIWMITLYANFQPPNAAASVQFMTTGLSTDGVTPYTYVAGTGAISVCGSASIAASVNSRVTGGLCITMVVPAGGATYYQLVNITHTFASMTCLGTQCFFNATRIA